jgi:hypothetical protein
MSSKYRRDVLYVMWLIAVTALAACAAAPAPKVRCDTDLRPINPVQHPLP